MRLALAPRLAQIPAPAEQLRLAVERFGPPASDQRTLLEDPAAARAARLREAIRQARAAAGPDAALRVLEVDPDSRFPGAPRGAGAVRGMMVLGPRRLGGPPSCVRGDGRRRRRSPRGRRGGREVDAVRESWLIEDRWWTERPLRRRYWEVVTTCGRNEVVFHDLQSGRWWRQR